MKKTSKLKRVILSISISTMLAFSLANSMFIHGVNSAQEFAPNISNELKSAGTHDIDEYKISRSYQEGNKVNYTINYIESGVWYWDQEKSDYKQKSWNKYSSNSWYYGPGISLGSTGDDDYHSGDQSFAPSFQIKYTGDRPSHEVEHPGEPDNPDTPWDDSTDSWTETVWDDWPNPSSHAFSNGYSGFRMTNSWTPSSNSTYTFEWTNLKSEMNSFPKLNKHWEYVSKDEGDWNQCTYDHWDWSGSDYWNSPDRAESGKGNERVYVDWKISSNSNTIDSGVKDINLHDIVVVTASQFAAGQAKPSSTEYETTDSERHSSTPPSINVPEPRDSDWYGVDGSETISIDNLPLGWEYLFEANLMYVDCDGNTHTYNTYTDTFSTSKTNNSSITIDGWSNNETSVVFNYSLVDRDNIRASDVRWNLVGDKGTNYSGVSQSNHFQKSFDVEEGENVTFSAEYDYALSNNLDGTANITPSATSSKTITTGNFYTDEVETFDFWIDNIQDDSLVFNYYISTNNNHLSDDYKINVNVNDSTFEIDPKLGTTSYYVPLLGDEKNLIFSAVLSGDGNTIEAENNNQSVNIDTNLLVDFSMRLIENSLITNTEANIDYQLIPLGIEEEINSIQYSLNGQWYDLDYEETDEVQTLELTNLNPTTEYEIYFKAKTDYRDYFSNTFKFKTDRGPSIYIDYDDEGHLLDKTSTGENSASMTFSTDKQEYIDVTEFTWGVQDRENDKVIYERTDEILNNGQKTIFADGLESNHDYRMILNAEIEGETIMLSQDVSTHRESNNTIDNSFIKSIDSKKNDYIVSYEGKMSSVQYSLNGVDWLTVAPKETSDGSFVISKSDIGNTDHVSFRINNQMRSQSSYYDGVDSTLIKPKDPINWNWNVFVIVIIVLFLIATITLVSIWAWWHTHKSETVKIEGNIWRQE